MPGDPEALERARGLAWRALNRRDRTEAELRERLAARGVEPAAADAVLAELREGGYVDDAAFAVRFAEDRRRLDGWGRERIARRLRELGVPAAHVDAALDARDETGELEGALALLERRVPAPPHDRRGRDRAIGLLLRRGYAPEVAVAALRRHAERAVAPPGAGDGGPFAHAPGRY